MTSAKHPKTVGPSRGDGHGDFPRPPDDLERNPGINTSKGVFSATGANPEELEVENTTEGDVMNDTTPQGGVDTRQQGRTNK